MGGEADGSTDFVPEDLGFGVTLVGVDEHAGNDPVAVECLPVCQVGHVLSCI